MFLLHKSPFKWLIGKIKNNSDKHLENVVVLILQRNRTNRMCVYVCVIETIEYVCVCVCYIISVYIYIYDLLKGIGSNDYGGCQVPRCAGQTESASWTPGEPMD